MANEIKSFDSCYCLVSFSPFDLKRDVYLSFTIKSLPALWTPCCSRHNFKSHQKFKLGWNCENNSHLITDLNYYGHQNLVPRVPVTALVKIFLRSRRVLAAISARIAAHFWLQRFPHLAEISVPRRDHSRDRSEILEILAAKNAPRSRWDHGKIFTREQKQQQQTERTEHFCRLCSFYLCLHFSGLTATPLRMFCLHVRQHWKIYRLTIWICIWYDNISYFVSRGKIMCSGSCYFKCSMCMPLNMISRKIALSTSSNLTLPS